MRQINAIVSTVFVASLMLSAKQCSAQRPSSSGSSTSIDKVKMDFRVRAQFPGECSGAILANRKLYCLTQSGLLVYSLIARRGAALVQSINLLGVTNPRDVALSLDGQKMYVADYSSQKIQTYSVPQDARHAITRLPLESTKCQLNCRPTSLSIDATTGDLLVVCSDDKQVWKCSSSGVESLELQRSASRLIHATWLMTGRQFASLIQTQSGYAICISSLDGSTSCPYTVQQATPVYLISTPDNSFTIVDQASNNALYAYGPSGNDQRGFKIPLNANIQSPSGILIDYIDSRMAVISKSIVTVFDVQVTIT